MRITYKEKYKRNSLPEMLATLIGFTLGLVSESYQESLAIKQFQDGKVLADFNFNRTMFPGTRGQQDSMYEITPKALGEIFKKYSVQELHLTFTQGRWNTERWGQFESAPQGVVLWAWLSDQDIQEKWKGLTNALAGLFCASLNYMDSSMTSEPLLAFQPRGHLFDGILN